MLVIKRSLTLLILLFIAPSVSMAANGSGLPIPRWVSLKSEEVNVRTGPGTRYPIQWVYRREGLPVEVVEEFDIWRKIRDAEGSGGWVHKTMLDGKRNVMVKGKEAQVMRATPELKSHPVLKAEPMVIGRLIECEKERCRIQISGHKGWLEKKILWGVYPDEVIE